MGVSRDTTESKKTEEALRESEQRYRSLVESTEDSIYLVDRSCRYLFMNEKHLSRFGLPKDSVIGRSYGEFHSKGETKGFARKVKEVFETGKSLDYEYRSQRDGGYFLRTLSPIKEPDGKPVAVTVVSKDITDRKLAQQALLESELWMRSMFNSMEEAVFIITPDRVIVDINEASTRMFGYSKDEVMNRSTEILHVDHDHYLEFGGRMKEAFDKGQAARFEFDMKRKNGEIFPSERTISLLKDDKGKHIGILSVIRDLSERKRAEEEKKKLEAQFQAAQRMEAMGTLAGGIAHNFNNILMGIQGNTSLVLLNKTSTHPDYERLKGIEQGVKSGAELTRELLGFTRGGKYEVRPTNLNELIENQSRMFGRTKKQITIRGKYEDNLLPVEVDQGQIGQALLNLYVNAWQA
ncbi:unnamed protein product, partial [marine sediment metagenome]